MLFFTVCGAGGEPTGCKRESLINSCSLNIQREATPAKTIDLPTNQPIYQYKYIFLRDKCVINIIINII